jgi:hypothetical protein
MENDVYRFKYLADSKILIGEVLKENIDKEEADIIDAVTAKEMPNQPEFIGFIRDSRKIKKISTYALGRAMKELPNMPKTKNYMVTVMTEELLQELMLKYPEMFDYWAFFHTIEDAVKFITSKQ